MQFTREAPGNLTQEGDTFYADWSVADSNFGYTKSQVEGWVSSALNEPLGWEQAGIQFRQVASGNVIFQVVETIAPPAPAGYIGIARWNELPVRVELEVAEFGNDSLVLHEAAHAFFYADHSPEGADSILEPMVDAPSENPSAADIAQLEGWLAGAAADTTYWFPADLEHYIAPWTIPVGARTRFAATSLDPAPALIRPVYSYNYEAMVAGEWNQFGTGIPCNLYGFYVTEWRDVPASGDLYIGVVVEAEAGVSLDGLRIGLAEVQISMQGEGGGSPIPN